jgi:hypothetical protein
MVGAGGSGAACAGGQQFMDRSKVRILLCDGGSNSSSEVLRLLCNCSYQGQLTHPLLVVLPPRSPPLCEGVGGDGINYQESVGDGR